MMHLFGKKEGSPEERIEQCMQKRDWAGMVKVY